MTTRTTSGTHRVPDVVLLQAAGREVRAADVVASLHAAQSFAPIVERAARGVAARRVREAPDDARRAHEADFRRTRHLATAEEMERWLAAWQLGVPEWRGAMRRACALLRTPAPPPPTAEDRAAVDDSVVWSELVCGGSLASATRDIARRMSAAAALDLDPESPPSDILDRWKQASVTEAHVDRELSDRALDWLRIAWVTLEAPAVDAAREARLCLDEDGMPPARVAALLGSPPVEGDDWLHRAPTELRDALIEVEAGRTSPPREDTDGRVRLVHVLRRTAPDAAEPTLRDSVRTHLAEQALDLEVRDRVQWHVDF